MFIDKDHARGIFPESSFRLLDRLFEPGDLCKRNIEDAESAVVNRIDIEFRVQQSITGKSIDWWLTKEDLDYSLDLHVGDYVTYGDWVGQVGD